MIADASRFGPLIGPDGVTFRLWAPAAQRVDLVLAERHADAAQPATAGSTLTLPGAGAGTRYRFRIDDEIEVPDPASRFQPDDVHGPSEVIDQAYRLAGARLARPAVARMRVFSNCMSARSRREGTFSRRHREARSRRRDRLHRDRADAGRGFPGRWNWGYDGVLLFAPDSVYGRPEDLKALIDAAHAARADGVPRRRLQPLRPGGKLSRPLRAAVLHAAPTRPGAARSTTSFPRCARFAIENALHWLDDYRFDGLRLDAVHAIAEPGRTTLLEELSEARRRARRARPAGTSIWCWKTTTTRRACSIRSRDPPRGKYRAQWNDDYHHALHVLLTGETHGYYRDYRDRERHLARTLAEGFAYQGEPSPHRNGAARAASRAVALPPTAFVNFLQNHDQIGNRALRRAARRARAAAGARSRAGHDAARAHAAADVHGRRMGRARAVPVLLRFQGRSRRGGARGPAARIRRSLCAPRRTMPDPLARANVPSGVARLERASNGPSTPRLALVRRPARRPAARTSCRDCRRLVPGHGHAAISTRRAARARWNFRTGETLAILANLDRRGPRFGPRSGRRPRRSGAAVPPQETCQPWSVLCRDRGALDAARPFRSPPTGLQLSKDFGFDDAARLVPYLKALGITHLYASPFLKARAGSTTATTSIDHSALNPEFGGEDGLRAARRRARRTPTSVSFSISFRTTWRSARRQCLVARRAGVGPQVAARRVSSTSTGSCCRYRRGGGVLLPVLGSPYGEALTARRDRAQIRSAGGQLLGLVFRAPLSDQPATLQRNPQDRRGGRERGRRTGRTRTAGARQPHMAAGRAVLRAGARIEEALAAAPRRGRRSSSAGLCAYRADREAAASVCCTACSNGSTIASPTGGSPSSDINYRRFFDINELAGLARRGHAHVPRRCTSWWPADRRRTSCRLRLDHIDGLLDPLQYIRAPAAVHPQRAAPRPSRDRPFYVMVEKILAEGEQLPPFSGVAGTTATNGSTCISRLLVERGRAGETLDALWRSIDAGSSRRFRDSAREREAPRARHHPGERIQRADAALARIAAGSLQHPRLRHRPVAQRAAASTCSNSRSIAPTSRAAWLQRRSTASSIGRTIDAARRRWHGHRRRHLRFPARRAHARSHSRPAQATAARASGNSR